VAEHRDDDGDDRVAQLRAASVEVLAEPHDVDAVLTERGAHGRRRVGLPRRELQLDVTRNFLLTRSHFGGPLSRATPWLPICSLCRPRRSARRHSCATQSRLDACRYPVRLALL